MIAWAVAEAEAARSRSGCATVLEAQALDAAAAQDGCAGTRLKRSFHRPSRRCCARGPSARSTPRRRPGTVRRARPSFKPAVRSDRPEARAASLKSPRKSHLPVLLDAVEAEAVHAKHLEPMSGVELHVLAGGHERAPPAGPGMVALHPQVVFEEVPAETVAITLLQGRAWDRLMASNARRSRGS